MNIVGISGSIGSPSRTRALIENILSTASQKTHSHYELIDIAEIAKDLGPTVAYDQLPAVLAAAYQKLAQADLIVIGTPVYKASYTGLLKHFFDLLDPKLLNGKVAILSATGGTDQHALVLEYQLRPLASFFNMVTVPTTIYARDLEFTDYKLHSESIQRRINSAVDQALSLLAPVDVDAVAAEELAA